MMPGCSSLADVRASRWKRSTNSLSKARENGRTLMATSRSSCFSRALKTIAMPPAAELLEDVVLVLQLIPHELQLRHLGLLVLGGADRRRRQIQPAGAAELAAVVVLGAAAGAVHPFSGETVKARDRPERVSTD